VTRKNRTWDIRHLAQPIRDVGRAGRRESVAGAQQLSSILSQPLPGSSSRNALNFSICNDFGRVYLSVAMALANKKTGQMAITTIIAKATSSDR
jgi:hypothetical protein